MKLRVLFIGCLSLALCLGCSKGDEYDDSKVTSQINTNSGKLSSLESQINIINQEVTSLRGVILAMQQHVFVKEAVRVNDAWVISFTDGTSFTLRDGKDGIDGVNNKDAAYLGVRSYEGIYYWTVTTGGYTTWLLDNNGKKIRVNGTDGLNGTDGVNGKDGHNGVSPLLRIDLNGYWEVSYNNGVTYTFVLDSNGNKIYALGGSGSGGNLFANIEEKENEFLFILTNGTVLTVPKLKGFYLTFAKQEGIPAYRGATISVPFTVAGVDSETFVECCAHGNCFARVNYEKGESTGNVRVQITGNITSDTKVVVFLCNSETTITYVLTFYEEILKYPNMPDDEPWPNFPDGNDPEIPGPSVDIVPDGNKYLLTMTLPGVRLSDGTWLKFYGTNDPKQNIWIGIDGVSKGFIVEDISENQATAKADLVFLVDNSGTMSEEADVIARDIAAWAQQLTQSNLDMRFGIVGYDGCIHGALNMTSASALSSYLNSNGTGTSRTHHFGGPDAATLSREANNYPKNCQTECGGVALHYANRLFDFRQGANRVYVNFTDEGNQPPSDIYSVNWVKNQNNWPLGSGTIHTVFSESKVYQGENPWLFSDYTGGTTIFTDSRFTGVDLNSLPVTGALTYSTVLRMYLSLDMLNGTHTVTIVLKDPYGRYYSKKVFYNVKFTL